MGEYVYEDIRIDINSKGKHRARKNNPVQPNQVTQLPYPIKAKPLGKFRYFQKREEWKETEEMQAKMNVQNVPEMSEMITNLFGGGAPAPKKKTGGGASSTVRPRRQ